MAKDLRNSKVILGVAKVTRQEIVGAKSSKGLCFTASSSLVQSLKQFRPKIVFGRVAIKCSKHHLHQGYHWWVEIKNKILDVTGDQFNCIEASIPEIIFASYKMFPEYQIAERFVPERLWIGS